MSEISWFVREYGGIKFAIQWVIGGPNPCHKCVELATRTFSEQDITDGGLLVDMKFGPVWDLQHENSLIHPNCMCFLDMQMDINPEEMKVGFGMVTVGEIKIEIANLKTEMSNLEMGYHELRELETILRRTLFIIEQSTGSKEIGEAVNAFQRLISIIRMAQFTWHAFMAASGPLGLLFAISGLAVTAVYTGASIQSLQRPNY